MSDTKRPSPSLPLQRWRHLARAWRLFSEDGVALDGPAPLLDRSWVRVRELTRADPALRRAQRMGPEALAQRRRHDVVFRLAQPVLGPFARRLVSARHVLAYFDAAGWMLDIQGNPGVIEDVAEIQFAPGARWPEESAVADRSGTAARGGEAVEVGPEHAGLPGQRWSCAGAPILARGVEAPVGLVDITGPWEARSPRAPALVSAVAREVEERLATAHSVRDEVIRYAFRAARGSAEPLLAVDAEGWILAANAAGGARIGQPARCLPADLRGAVDPMSGSTEDGRVVEWQGLRLVSQAVLHDGCPVGAVIRAVPGAAPRVRPASRVLTSVRWRFDRILRESPGLEGAVILARVAARNALPVVLAGESGTGKELLAQAIHGSGPRREGPFVAVACGAIPGALLEAELSGYEAGAFAGRQEGNGSGKFEQAHGGTLFLDEVAELTGQAQLALLRLLQEQEVVPLGATSPRRVDVRVIAATNRSLRGEVATGRFRPDLLERLAVHSILLPPLRQRIDDVPTLVEAFLADARVEVGRSGLRISGDAMAVLQACAWPDNVRQLRNAIQRAAALAPGLEIRAEDLPSELRTAAPAASRAAPPSGRERDALEAHLLRRQWNLARVAAELGVSRMTLYRRLERLGLRRPSR